LSVLPAPPWLARKLLALAIPDDDLEHVGGDLQEMFSRECGTRGLARAHVWYWVQALSFTSRFLAERVRERKTRREELAALWDGLRSASHPHPIMGNPQDRRWSMGRTLEGWSRDFLLAGRSLLRAPVFTLVTVVTLALAIGANTAIFSVVQAVLLEGLPFPASERLVSIMGVAPGTDLDGEIGVSDELFVQYRENADRLEDLALYGLFQSTTRVEERVERLFGIQTTASLFSTLGVRPVLGRLPTDEDDPNVVVISHRLWTEWFNSDPDVLNRSYEFANQSRSVIGVMGPEFRFPDERVDLWIPVRIDAAAVRPGGFGTRVVARMRPDTDHEALMAQLAPLSRRVLDQFPGPAPFVRIMEQHRPVVRSLEEQLVGALATPLWILMGTVAIVLLMACANVANLFGVRAESRRQDLAVRRALGAGRGGLIRGQMAEALVLAGVSAVIGLAIAWVTVPVLVRSAPEGLGGWSGAPVPRLTNVGIDLTALLFTAGVAILAACLFGLVPAIRFSGARMLDTLRQAGRGIVGRRHIGRDALVVLQTASALVLLVGSALLVRSFMKLKNVDPGYETRDIFTFQIAPDREDLDNLPAMVRFHYGFMERLAGLPGVESVGVVGLLPLDEGAGEAFVATEQTDATGAEAPLVRQTPVGGDYFQTMGIDLIRGRYFERSDEDPGVFNVVIGEAAADMLWPGEDALGQRIRPSESQTWYNVVGVVENIMIDDFRRQSPEPLVYLPRVIGSPAYVLKSARAHVIAPEVRELIREVVPESPMYRVFTMEDLAARSMATLSFTMTMLAVAAVLALILGAAGLYGVLSYVVAQRTREIGIRMALGAEATSLRRMVVAQGGFVALIGVAIGIITALLATRVLETQLFGVGAMDVPTFAAMSLVMIAIALLASYVPARRASAVDPMRSLRAE
jgi:predicted permease